MTYHSVRSSESRGSLNIDVRLRVVVRHVISMNDSALAILVISSYLSLSITLYFLNR